MRQTSNTGRHDFDFNVKKLTKMTTHRARSKVPTSLKVVSCLALFLGFDMLALAGEVAPGKQTAFLYDIDMDFMYLTEARGFSTPKSSISAVNFSQAGLTASGSGTGTFGLKKAAFGFEWRLPRGVGFQASVRPDAAQDRDVGTTEPTRELDTRSGRVVEEMPSIHFLDEYRLIVKKQSVEARVGVESSTLESFRVTPDLLGFGLRVRGPEKSFSAGIYAPEVFYLGESKSDDVVGFGLGVLSGRDERHDGRSGESTEIGESPAKRDPYWGASASLSANLAGQTRLALAAAMIEERQLGAKMRQEWYGLGVRRSLGGALLSKAIVAIEARQLRESFRMEGTEISDVRLMSFGVTSMLYRNSDEAALLGFWVGTGDIHPEGVLSTSRSAKGFQAEAGWRWLVEEQLEFVTMVSREWRRDGAEFGGTQGGFVYGSTNRSAQSRFAIQMLYKIGGQI